MGDPPGPLAAAPLERAEDRILAPFGRPGRHSDEQHEDRHDGDRRERDERVAHVARADEEHLGEDERDCPHPQESFRRPAQAAHRGAPTSRRLGVRATVRQS